MAFYATDSRQGSPEETGLEICPSHLLTCHRGSPVSHGSPDHSLNFPFGTRLWDFPRAHHTSPCKALMASSLHPYLWRFVPWKLQNWTQALSRHLAGGKSKNFTVRDEPKKWSRLKLLSQRVNCSLDYLQKPVYCTNILLAQWQNGELPLLLVSHATFRPKLVLPRLQNQGKMALAQKHITLCELWT